MKIEPGTRIGDYRIVRPIGEGGMGAVFEAEQLEPVRRTVAIKVLKEGRASKQVLARFEAERQALARLDHPHIAKVFDAGRTDADLPYFVMEYVRGQTLTGFCREERLGLPERIEIFIDVCQAVQHAHLKGIIHRDLKPANLLVSRVGGKPMPMVIDFGIAKATANPLTDLTLVTNYSQLLGTPAYMSPEQADPSGLDVDIRTDVYALGVLLYELITDHLPFDQERVRSSSLQEIQRILWEEDPPLPSRRLEELGPELVKVARLLASSPRDLINRIRGDLDWITMKAMEKDRTQRYQSMAALADDLHHFLRDEPVSASPPAFGYLARKFIRRHRLAVTAGASLVGMMIVSTGLSTWWALKARRAEAEETAAREAAQHQARVARETVAFLTEDLFRQAAPQSAFDLDVRLKEVMDRAAGKLETRFDDQPLVKAALYRTLAGVYVSLGDASRAEDLLNQGRSLLREREATDSEAYVELGFGVVEHLEHLGRYDAALTAGEETLGLARTVLGEDHAVTGRLHGKLGQLYIRKGFVTEALGHLREADRVAMRDGDEREVRANGMWLARAYALSGEFERSENMLREIRKAIEQDDEDEAYRLWLCLNLLAISYFERGRYDESERTLMEVRERGLELLGEDSPALVSMLRNFGMLERGRGNFEKAQAAFEHALERTSSVVGAEHEKSLVVMEDLAVNAQNRKAFHEAVDRWEALLETRLGKSHHSHDQAKRAYDALQGLLQSLDRPEDWQKIQLRIVGEVPWESARTVSLIEKGAVWQWKEAPILQEASENWRAKGKDLSHWDESPAPFGFGESEVVTKVSKAPVTHYFRKVFSVADPDQLAQLKLRLRRDDAVAVYLNGREVLRHYLPPEAETTPSTRSLRMSGGFEEQLYYVTLLETDLLEPGENLLAVEIHQHAATSSDLFFDASLEALKR